MCLNLVKVACIRACLEHNYPKHKYPHSTVYMSDCPIPNTGQYIVALNGIHYFASKCAKPDNYSTIGYSITFIPLFQIRISFHGKPVRRYSERIHVNQTLIIIRNKSKADS